MNPDDGDYGHLPLDLPEVAGVPARSALARMDLDVARWSALTEIEKITAVGTRLFPGMAYVDRAFNPIRRTVFYLDRYAEADSVAPAGEVASAPQPTDAQLRDAAACLRDELRCAQADARAWRYTAGVLLVVSVGLLLTRR